MNMLDSDARKDLELRLREFFGPLGLQRFIILGFNADGEGYVVEVGHRLPPELVRDLLMSVAARIDPRNEFTLEDS